MKILLATDASPGSSIARDLVAALELPPSTEIHLVGAYEIPIQWAPQLGTGADWLDDLHEALHDDARGSVAAAAEPFRARGLAVTEHVVRGRAATAICETAAAVNADLVVTGSRGRGPLAATLLGSVAAEVATSAPCPVLVARSAGVGRLLVATDGSTGAAAITEFLGASNLFRGVPADVVAVSIPDSPGFELLVGLYTLGDERLAAKRRELREAYGADADAVARQLEAIGIPATPHVRSGDPAQEILEAARDHGSDLIITGTRGLSAIGRMLLGSVARNVLTHADASVLVVREREPVRKDESA